jgi:VWFA-related protein
MLLRLSGSGVAQVAPPPPTFPAGVELITVDAVVLDAGGRPVPGLTRDDFVVKEDGRPREIVSFEAFEAGTPSEEPEDPTAAIVASNATTATGTGRAFAIVIDDVRIAAELVDGARKTAATFLNRFVRYGDFVTLATTSGQIWWSARIPEGKEDLLAVLARARGHHAEVPLLDRMTEYEAYWIANHEDSPGVTSLAPGASVSLAGRASSMVPEAIPGGSIKERVKQRWERANVCAPLYCDSLVRSRAAEIDAYRRSRTQLTLQCVRRALEALAPVRGRKSLLLLSEGFLQDSGSDQLAVTAASREANTAVYFVDVRGLVAIPGFGSAADVGAPPDPRDRTAESFEEAVLESQGAQGLAEDTGGFSVRNTNDLASGVWRITAESRVFYLLGFYPPEGKSPREWRNLRVEVKRPGLRVRARRGYTLRSEIASAAPATKAKDDGKGPALAPAVARALDSAHDATGIPLRAVVYVLEGRPNNTVHVLVAAELDASAVTLRPRGADRAARLELSTVALLRDAGRSFRHDDVVEVTAAEGSSPGWRAVTREFELPPGVGQVRVVVRDPVSGALGSVSRRIEVPFPGDLRLSTPILTDRVEPASAAGERPRPALAAHRVFPPEGGLYCQFEVFGAARPGGAMPRVSAGFALWRGTTRLVLEAAPTPITPDSDGRLVRLAGMALDGLDEGEYELALEVQDQVSGDRVRRREPFVLARSADSR